MTYNDAVTAACESSRWVWYQRRGNDHGVSFEVTWPHMSLGASLHVGRFGHLSLHLPFGLVIIGCIGAPWEPINP